MLGLFEEVEVFPDSIYEEEEEANEGATLVEAVKGIPDASLRATPAKKPNAIVAADARTTPAKKAKASPPGGSGGA
eukprot:10415926-Heterocapsa_arctica.AAC.1